MSGLGEFSFHAEQSDQPHPLADAQVIAQQVEEPDGADGGEGHGEQDDGRLRERAGVQLNQEQGQEQV